MSTMENESKRDAAIRLTMMPRDTNAHGTVFGGVILSYLDQAGAIGARRAVALAGGGQAHLVTVAINRVEFHRPVLVGDVVSDIMDTCLQFHGGWGYIEDFPIARAWRDQRLFRIGGGTTETMKYYIAKLMGF